MESSPTNPSNPPKAKLEKALRDAVAILSAADSTEPFTVNNARKKAESILNLEEGFYTRNAKWKGESKRIIKAEVDNVNTASSELSPSQQDIRQPQDVADSEGSSHASRKRPRSEAENPNAPSKKQKKSTPSSNSSSRLSSPPASSSQSETIEDKVTQKRSGRPAKPKPGSTSAGQKNTDKKMRENGSSKRNNTVPDDSQSELSSIPENDLPSLKPDPDGAEDAVSEDDMSVVLDEPAKPKKRAKTSKGRPAKESNKVSRTKAKADSELLPEEAEIKRLQGWLVKCGVRKLWGKELKPYNTSKAKITHLRQMLEDIGMTGRFSMEKARDIREKRELAADLAEVQDRTQRWGKDDSSDPGSGEKPKRKLVRGSRNLDFLSENDGEESD